VLIANAPQLIDIGGDRLLLAELRGSAAHLGSYPIPFRLGIKDARGIVGFIGALLGEYIYCPRASERDGESRINYDAGECEYRNNEKHIDYFLHNYLQ